MGTTASAVVSTVAPTLAGVWVHAIADPGESERAYAYQSGERGETIKVASSALRFIGRRYAVIEYGDEESHELKLAVKVPVDDEHDASVEALRQYTRGRRTLCYRDNRGRLIFGVIVSLALSDTRDGTNASFDFQRVDYDGGI